jgi:alcohol dehydrogenase class IV
VAIFDIVEMHAKTGIASRAIRPVEGIVDPENTRTLPPVIAACTGFDVMVHALESYTALPYNRRLAPEVETVFLMPQEDYFFLSSSMVKELAVLGADLSAFVPAKVEKELKAKLIRK